MSGETISVVPGEVIVSPASDLIQPPQPEPAHKRETVLFESSPSASESDMVILRKYNHFPLEPEMGFHEVDKCPNCIDNGGSTIIH